MSVDPRVVLPPGSVLQRREPRGDEFDTLVVIGHLSADESVVEPIVQPLAFTHGPMPASVESLDESYLLVREGARPGVWETPVEDVLTRTDSTLQDPGGASRVMQEARRETGDEEPGLAVQAYRKFIEKQEEQDHDEDR